MPTNEACTAEVMPIIRRVLEVIGPKYPKARWAVSAPPDDIYVELHLYLDPKNTWRIHDLTRPVITNAGLDAPQILILVHPAMEAELPGVFTAPVVSRYSPPN